MKFDFLKKIGEIKLNFREIILILCVLFFTVIMNYVNVNPYIKDIARKDRILQLFAVFIVSVTFIMSFRSTYDIKLEFIVNSLIVTLIFGFLTKPKNMLEKEIDVIANDIDKIRSKEHSQSKPLSKL